MFAIEIHKMSGLFSFSIYKDIWTKLYLQYWLVPFWIASNKPYFLKTPLKGRKIMFSENYVLHSIISFSRSSSLSFLKHVFMEGKNWTLLQIHFSNLNLQKRVSFKNLFNHYIYSQMMFACCWTKAWYYTITTFWFCLRWLAWLI